jgi:alkylhydroperoxidase/carboxymuconolactone decarboxylase family protein YurZ
MVPVPEELASKVLSYVSWKGAPSSGGGSDAPAHAAATADDDSDSVGVEGGPTARAFARLDAASRALIAVAATAALQDEALSIPEAARRAGVTTREALGILMEVNNVLVAEGGPAIGFTRKDQEGPATGQFSWDPVIVTMPEALARSVDDLARSDTST